MQASMTSPDTHLVFATPRKLPKARTLEGRVVVIDLAFASEASGGGFEGITLPFIEALGPRLAAWVDHHDHAQHKRFADDPRFVLATKAQHGACPEMIDPALVERIGPAQTIVCHPDFDGLAAAAKWLRTGVEPYPGCDLDARAIDTRMGTPSPVAEMIDRALRARPRDQSLSGMVVRHLATGLSDAALTATIQLAADEMRALEASTRRLALGYVRLDPGVAVVDITGRTSAVDKTQLLLMGQDRERIAMVVDGDSITLATRFDAGIDLLKLLGLSGGMPTRVSVHRNRLDQVCEALGIRPDDMSSVALRR